MIYIGRLEKTKNLGFLLKALEKLGKKRKKISLCLLGSGKEERNLAGMIKKGHLEDRVEMVEPKHNVEDFLAQSRIFVYSPLSRVEGFPVAILEAMAVGTPVLARDFAGLDEFLTEGKNCFLFKNEQEFIKKALWLLNHPQEGKKIAASARRRAQRHHSPQNMIDYLEELELIKEKK